MKPNLMSPDLYKSKSIPEYLRIAFTRFRLSSHRLKFETGRWSRIPSNQRLCECGNIQDEEHVLLFCEQTKYIRQKYNVNHKSLNTFFEDKMLTENDKCLSICQTLKVFESDKI